MSLVSTVQVFNQNGKPVKEERTSFGNGFVLVLQKDLVHHQLPDAWVGTQPANVSEVLHMTPCTLNCQRPPHGPWHSLSSCFCLRHSACQSKSTHSLRSREENTGPLTRPALTDRPPRLPSHQQPPPPMTRWVRPWSSWPTWHWPGVRGGGCLGGDFILSTSSHKPSPSDFSSKPGMDDIFSPWEPGLILQLVSAVPVT